MAGAVELPRVLGGFPACALPAISFVAFVGAVVAPGFPVCSLASNSSTRFWSRPTLSNSSSTLSNSNCSRSVSPDSALVVLAGFAADAVGALLGFASSSARPVPQIPRLSSTNIPISTNRFCPDKVRIYFLPTTFPQSHLSRPSRTQSYRKDCSELILVDCRVTILTQAICVCADHGLLRFFWELKKRTCFL